MAERNMKPVKVTLDRQRPYRVNDSDTGAALVGPGEVEVPTWVAEAWGLAPAPQGEPEQPTPPVDIPDDAVSATVETVKEEPLKTTEVVETVTPSDEKAAARKGGKAG